MFNISLSPHIHADSSVKRIMYDVIIALMPAVLLSIYYFGIGAFIVTFSSVFFCVLIEWFIQKYMLKKETSILDGSAALSGLLLGLCLPANLPIWIVFIGAVVTIGIAKMSFGGLGNNPFNPALVGRVFLLVSFPVQMTQWPVPSLSRMHYTDADTGATILTKIKEALSMGATVPEIMNDFPTYKEMFLGFTGGSIGEISELALILGGIYLVYRKVISWHIPVIIIATMFLFAEILFNVDKDHYVNPIIHLLSGSTFLGAIFMATDYVTSPMKKTGMVIYAIGIGALTILIRVFGAYPEGISFAILIMNAFVPLLNKIPGKRFGVIALNK